MIFDALTRQQRAVVELPWPAYGIAVTPDSRRAVVNGANGYAVVDLAQARLVDEPVPMEEISRQIGANGAEVSPDGRWAALARGGEVVVVDLTTGKVDRRAVVAEQAGRRPDTGLVGGLHDPGRRHEHRLAARAVRCRAHRSRAATAHHRRAGSGTSRSAPTDGCSPASATRATSCCGTPAPGDPTGSRSPTTGRSGWLTFSADGRALRVFFDDHHVVQVSTSPRDWVTAACRAAGRNLTPAESAAILPGRPVRPTCPEIP